jgi:hypothetical protein
MTEALMKPLGQKLGRADGGPPPSSMPKLKMIVNFDADGNLTVGERVQLRTP